MAGAEPPQHGLGPCGSGARAARCRGPGQRISGRTRHAWPAGPPDRQSNWSDDRRRRARGSEHRPITGRSRMGTPCSVMTSPLVGCGVRTRYQPEPARRPVLQPELRGVVSGMASPSFGRTSEPVEGIERQVQRRPVGSSIWSIGNPSGPSTLGRLRLAVEPIGATSNRSPGSSAAPKRTCGS